MTKLYAGIGTRERKLPKHISILMTKISVKLEQLGYILRSGHASGSDKSFELGVKCTENKEIFRAKHATLDSINLASKYHPYWDNCDLYARKLHGRNAMIILGDFLKKPVTFVICYTPDGKHSGGTGLALNIAEDNKIPIFNLFYPTARKRLEDFINIKKDNVDML